MSTALFVSPHLDDVAFSCGGTLARLKSLGWELVLVGPDLAPRLRRVLTGETLPP